MKRLSCLLMAFAFGAIVKGRPIDTNETMHNSHHCIMKPNHMNGTLMPMNGTSISMNGTTMPLNGPLSRLRRMNENSMDHHGNNYPDHNNNHDHNQNHNHNHNNNNHDHNNNHYPNNTHYNHGH